MQTVQRERLIKLHGISHAAHGYAPDTLFWPSRGLQKTLFSVLADIGTQSGDSLLDVGCGFGDLYSWLHGAGLTVSYTGIDLSPEILETAARMNPGLDFRCGELFDFDWSAQSFDWVLLSGTLNWELDDDGDYERRLIRRMFDICRRGVAFNMLDLRHYKTTAMGEMKAHDPAAMLAFCQTITPDCSVQADYLPDDFTIYMQRQGALK